MRQEQVPAGLPGKLLAAVRPEFRAVVLTFDPQDPVFGGPACAAATTAIAPAASANGTSSGGQGPDGPA
jgi:hypothetical protein